MKCKICGSSVEPLEYGQAGSKAHAVYYFCGDCRFISKDSSFYLESEKERQRYLLHINTAQDSAYVEMLKQFLDTAVLPYVQPGGEALDYGCGPGPVLAGLLKEAGFDTNIYDIFFEPEKVFVGKTYDLITCTEVVEHLADPMETLMLLKSLLKPGGILAIMTMFHQGVEHFKSWWYRRDATHISFFHPETFRTIAGELDFQILIMDDKNTISIQR